MDMSALKDEAWAYWGTRHSQYGKSKANYNYSYSSAPAVANASSITSPAFGTLTPSYGWVGQSKNHDVQITR
jgi:hypothetical protein